MKNIIVVIVLLSTISSFGQRFPNDWKNFQCENWTLELMSDTSRYLDKRTQGRLIFHCISNESLEVEYFIFLDSDLDNSFKNKILHWFTIQSCLQITEGEFSFSSFRKNHYVYLLDPCTNCHTAYFTPCKNLSKKLEEFVPIDQSTILFKNKNGP